MKKILLIIFVLTSALSFGQFSPTVDTLRFMSSRGKLYEVITYSDDSIQINGIMLQSGASTTTTNWWAYAGAGYITTSDPTDQIKYPGIKIWNYNIAAPYDAPVWYRKSDNTLRVSTTAAQGLVETETVTGQVDTYIYETQAADINVNIDSLAKIPQSFVIKNNGRGSVITITPLESGVVFDSSGVTSKAISYGEWLRITPSATKFITTSNEAIVDSVSYYTKTESDTLFVLSSAPRDSLYRYNAYESGEENIEVLANTRSVTVSVTGGTNVAVVVPRGMQLISMKARFDSRLSFTVTIDYTGAESASMKNRWMPIVTGWREDSGQQLRPSTIMNTSVYNKFEVTGLESSTKCQVRLDF